MRPSRTERQVRNVGRGLFWISAILVCLSIAMTGKFGWSFGIDLADKPIFAATAATIDILGAFLMTTCGLLFGRKHYGAGVLALAFVLLCGGASAVSIYGYQSSNRTGVAKAREKAAKLDENALEWFKSLATIGPKGERQERIGDVKEQLRSLKGSLNELEPDTQASELAATFRTDPDSVRRVITMAGSGLILAAQFACLWLCGYLRQRVEPEASTISPDFARRFHATDLQSKERNARQDLLTLIAEGGTIASNKEAAERWNVDKATAHRYLEKFHAEGLIKRRRNGKRREIHGALNGHAKPS